MQTDHSKAIKGLSIAVIIISALAIIACIIGMGIMNLVFGMLDTYGYMDSYSAYDSYYYYYDDDYIDPAVLALISGFSNILLVLAIVCGVVTLIAGIMGLRYANAPEKQGIVFGWAIAGAIVGFLGMGIIVCVLEIIVAVFANKDKQLYRAGMYGANPYQQPAPAYTQAAPAQIPNAPVAPGIQPSNPQQPQADTAPAQENPTTPQQ